MRIRRALAVAATSLAMSGAVVAVTPGVAAAQADAYPERCWPTSWITGWWTGIAGHCVFDGVVYWYDFEGNYGVGWAV